MAATTASAAPAAPLPPPPAPAPAPPRPPPVPEQCMHKNRLQEFMQRNLQMKLNGQKFPSYKIDTEGQPHALKFTCTVKVGTEEFSSPRSYSCRKDAEQDAARIAYEILTKREDGGGAIDVFELIDQDMVFCKSILYEFAVKKKVTQPSYSVTKSEMLSPMPLFVASVFFNENTYIGDAAKSKKDAEQKAARAAIKAILATKDAHLLQIIRSKRSIITAVTSSGYNKEVVSEETQNTARNTLPFVPVSFTAPVMYETYDIPQTANGIPHGTSMQAPLHVSVPNVKESLPGGTTKPAAQLDSALVPPAHPSPQAVSGSKKRKKKTRRSEATEENAAKKH